MPSSIDELAAFAAEMISYTWFSPSEAAALSPTSLASPSISPLHTQHQAAALLQHQLSTSTTTTTLSPLSLPVVDSPLPPQPTPTAASSPTIKHILPSPEFVRFVAYVLHTTQVGQTAVLLGILYLERYRRVCVDSATAAGGRHRGGNEYRLFVTSLMLANKYSDDSSYTCSTWASISGLPLADIHSMERAFLAGVGFSLHVTAIEYRAWLARLYQLHQNRRETIKTLATLRSGAGQRPMSGGSHSSKPASSAFPFGGGGSLPPMSHPFALPLFGTPHQHPPPPTPSLEGFQLHPSYLHPQQHPPQAYLSAYHSLPPPSGLAQTLPPPPSGQITPRASFDGSASLLTVNVNPAISTPASHRTLDALAPSRTASSPRKPAGAKRRAGEAFSPGASPLSAVPQLSDGRPMKRLQTSPAKRLLEPFASAAGGQQRPSSSSTAGLSLGAWPPQPPVTGYALPSLNQHSTSPMHVLGQPFVFEGQDAMGAKQLFVCSLMADGPRRYQLIQQQCPPLPQNVLAGPAPAHAPAPYLLPVPGAPSYLYRAAQGQPIPSLPASNPPAMLPPGYTSAPMYLPPPPHALAQYPPQQHAYNPAPFLIHPPPAPHAAPVFANPAASSKPTAAPVVDALAHDAAKRSRVERWRREVSASSGGDY